MESGNGKNEDDEVSDNSDTDLEVFDDQEVNEYVNFYRHFDNVEMILSKF